jgi:hypothetical protein
MQYRIVYDLIDNGFPFWPYVYGVLVLLIVTIGNLWRRHRRGLRTRGARWFVMMAVVIALVTVAIPAWDFHRLGGRLARGDVLVAEGFVSGHLVETTRTRVTESGKNAGWHLRTSTWEGFRVGDTEFGYHRGTTRVGFLNGGDPPIEISDGTPMRIHYVIDSLGASRQQRILRVEMGAKP